MVASPCPPISRTVYLPVNAKLLPIGPLPKGGSLLKFKTPTWSEKIQGSGGKGGGGWWIGRLTAGVPGVGWGRSVGTQTYILENDPHDTLVMLNVHNWE